MSPQRHTATDHLPVSIVATLGPASADRGTIEQLAAAGTEVVRLNASHGSTADRAEIIERAYAVDATRDGTLAVLLDLPGPEIRTAPTDEPVSYATGDELLLTTEEDVTPERIGLSQPLNGVAPGDRVLLDDGRIEMSVLEVVEAGIRVMVDDGGKLGGRKGVNVPGVDLGLDVITEADEAELDLAVEAGVDFVAASFVRDAEDVYRVCEAIEERGGDIPVVAKIERADAVENLDGIIEAAGGVMVARGDLGVECPLEAVPLIQKRIIRNCRDAGVPVITATEMLDSMTHAGRPTRAETSDVANAVLDGTDAVMLSGETAIGDHPLKVVETMARIVQDVAESEEYAEQREQRVPKASGSGTDALARSARYLARDVGASAVVVATESGFTARKAAKYRPESPVVAATPSDTVRRRLVLHGGVVPRYVDLSAAGVDAVIHDAISAAIDAGVTDSGETVIALAGMMSDLDGVDATNTLKLHTAAAVLASGRAAAEGYASGPVYRVANGDLTGLPDGAIAYLPGELEGGFTGDPTTLAGIVDAGTRMTSYAAIVAREMGVPIVVDAELGSDVRDGDQITIDGHRGVVYDGSVERDHGSVSSNGE
ncbi:pyruvate kinase [Halolamina sp.]|uniref:pyruvate kinase n=1 Tax=Halolamina sp. TaxID=1940283 RepID=UPI000223BCC6|nr:pyruvate kinase [halophilic archaeon DL31]